jgi:hypothetical protein
MTETVASQSMDQVHANYVKARKAYKEAEHRFLAMMARFTDMPEALNTRLDHIEVAGPGKVAVNPPPAGPPWAQPATSAQKRIITREQWAHLDDYIAALTELKRKLEEAQRAYASLPELDHQLGSPYRSPLEP